MATEGGKVAQALELISGMTVLELAELKKAADEKFGVTATSFQTGVPPAIAVDMMARGEITRKGAFTPELLDPEPWPKELARRGMPVKVKELS